MSETEPLAAPLPEQPVIYCPLCGHCLTGAEEAGLDCCPECGAKLSFEHLRHLARTGLDLSRYSYWALVWKFFIITRSLREELKRPYYFIRLGEGRRARYGPFAVAAVLLGFAAALALRAPWLAIVVAAYPTLAALCLWTTRLWMGWLLRRVNHPDPRAAARRIMFVADTQCVPMAINFGAFLLGEAVVMLWHNYFVPQFIGVWLVFSTAVFHFFAWNSWSSAASRLLMCETRNLQARPGTRVLAEFSPGTVVMVLGPLGLALLSWLALM